MKRGMVDSNYLEELLDGIPDGLFDGNYSEEDLLKMVDLPMESFANDCCNGEFDVNEMQVPWPDAYNGYRPVDSAVWNTEAEQKPKEIPLNSSVSLLDPILSYDGVKPTVMPLNGLITGQPPVVEDQVMEPRPMIMPSATTFGLPWVVEDKVMNHTTTVLESKPKLIPSNSFVTKSKTMMIGSRVVVERNAHTDILPQHKPEIPANGKAKVFESGSSRINSPVSVLDTTSYNNSAQTSMSKIMSRGVRYGKRSKRPRSEHIKTPWFGITIIPPAAASAKNTFTNKNREKRTTTSQDSDRTTESKLFSSPSCWKKKQTTVVAPPPPPRGVVGTKKCSHCEVTKTPQWREGPNGPKTLCNACGVRYRSGRLFPEYRPAASPTFTPYLHSNSHRKVVEMRKQQAMPPPENKDQDLQEDPPRSPDSPLIENIPMIGHPFELIY